MKLNLNHLQLIPLLVMSMILTGCMRRDPEAEKREAFNQVLAKLRSCAPEQKTQDQKAPDQKAPDQKAEDKLTIAIAGVTINPNETAVKIVVYALAEDTDFDLPVYWMSRGRWLINEEGRTYLLDERCREYKLKERRSSTTEKLPPDGRIRLKRGQAFEAILSFPSLPDQTQIGVLVYGERTIPFWLLNQPQSQ
jgi:hypothetical protein